MRCKALQALQVLQALQALQRVAGLADLEPSDCNCKPFAPNTWLHGTHFCWLYVAVPLPNEYTLSSGPRYLLCCVRLVLLVHCCAW